MILFLFPYAGGSSLSFNTWLPHLSPYIRVITYDIPGRDRLYSTQPLDIDIPEMASSILPKISDAISQNEPFAFLGYSMGALLAFELARQISIFRPWHRLRYFFAFSCSAPNIKHTEDIYDFDDAAFDAAIHDYCGTPIEIIENTELMDMIRPALRRDIKASAKYDPGLGFALDCPVDAIGGRFDRWVSEIDLKSWSHVTKLFGEVKTYPDGHFFIEGREEEVSNYVLARLRQVGLL
ncbi:medium-chain acyl-[acyl-carrier-protein] hydrolase [Rhizobium tibeticum]|uniref:Linear gramicidin dehydrogenase LgrE n=1 Tax=Rhizobium tibeticum TaxID=501024 RepID=A0A1H8VZJ6_9HYPH|nr:thioesterase domain-containing protein [Rhizobium tibeticum]SEI19995.1 Linear gramicidin dehydrogenase LgrE [Rhizobium tibeticum]SEP20770.1 medium-chain acyl-[acyl-carrier-protein] hydrolase [Rhizobium tibeticum]